MQRSSHTWAVSLLVVVLTLLAAFPHPAVAQQQGPQAQIGAWDLDDVQDFEAGASSGLLVTNNAGGELRLADGQTSGAFISAPFTASFAFNAVGAVWSADLIDGTSLSFELRARATPPPTTGDQEAGWSAWQPLVSGDARSVTDKGAFATPDVVAFSSDSRYLQLRAVFSSQVARGSAVLSNLKVSYIRSTQASPLFASGLPHRPLLFGKETLTTRPVLIGRVDWSGRVEAAHPTRSDPRGIVIHQIDAASSPGTIVDLLRALLAYQTTVLGWEDMPYHYLIDGEGNLYEGRLGGPSAAVDRLAGGDTAIHVAVIAPRDTAPSETAQGVLINLLAWLGQAYGIAPAGQHFVVDGDTRSQRASIAGHNEVAAAPDPYQPMRDLLPQLRSRVDQSTVRARWYFAEGNVADYSQRLSFFNPTGAQADARVTLIQPGQSPVTQIVNVPANARADLTVNDLVQGATALPAIVESSAPILVERSMGLTTDIDGSPGIDQLSRIWYFAEGTTEGDARSYLILFNPQAAAVQATISYMRSDGTVFDQPVRIGGQDRLVVSVNDITLSDGTRPLNNSSFGMRIIAAQPIAAERTVRFGPNGSGLHTGRGITTLSRRWLFAEGTTQNGFGMKLLVLNPNDQAANTEAVFMGPDGRSETRRYAIPPRAQLTINVNEVIPNEGVSTTVQSDRPVAVERSLIFNNGAAGTIGAGATAPSYKWIFVEGRTNDASYYLCVSNPNRSATTVTVDFVFADGARGAQSFRVPGNSRYTFAVHQIYPNEGTVAAVVRANYPIVAERSIYPGGGQRGGATTLGIPMP